MCVFMCVPVRNSVSVCTDISVCGCHWVYIYAYVRAYLHICIPSFSYMWNYTLVFLCLRLRCVFIGVCILIYLSVPVILFVCLRMCLFFIACLNVCVWLMTAQILFVCFSFNVIVCVCMPVPLSASFSILLWLWWCGGELKCIQENLFVSFYFENKTK